MRVGSDSMHVLIARSDGGLCAVPSRVKDGELRVVERSSAWVVCLLGWATAKSEASTFKLIVGRSLFT